jgi:acid stress-induced BolA-like protein IbaG/YrbA
MALRTPEEIKAIIVGKFPDAQVVLKDLTGTGDHWQVTIVTKAFEGKGMLDQHRLVKSIFEADINSGAVHAFSLKTYTPEEWAKKS